MMTPGPEALSWRGEISLTKILHKRKAREKERKTNEHIKGRREEHSDNIATQRRGVHIDFKKKREEKIQEFPSATPKPQTYQL